MKNFLIILTLVVSSLFLSGCQIQKTAPAPNTPVQKTGQLQVKSGDSYLLSTPEGIINITSNKTNLDNYLKKNITVTGQFSGDILYVDDLKISN